MRKHLPYPSFNIAAFSQENWREIQEIQGSIYGVYNYITQFESALKLHRFAGEQLEIARKMRPPLGSEEDPNIFLDKVHLYGHWTQFAMRGAVMALYNLRKKITALKIQCRKVAEFYDKLDASKFRRAEALLNANFPGSEEIRDSIGHQEEFSAPGPRGFEKHKITGQVDNDIFKIDGENVQLILLGNVVGDDFITTYKGRTHKLTLNEGSLQHLTSAILIFMSAFAPVSWTT